MCSSDIVQSVVSSKTLQPLLNTINVYQPEVTRSMCSSRRLQECGDYRKQAGPSTKSCLSAKMKCNMTSHGTLTWPEMAQAPE